MTTTDRSGSGRVASGTSRSSFLPSVVMLVRNPGVYDTRVRKEASALSKMGYDVSVFALAAPGHDDVETLDGVDFVRIPVAIRSPALFAARYRIRSELRRDLYLARQSGAADARAHAATRFRRRRQMAKRRYGATVSRLGGVKRLEDRRVRATVMRRRRDASVEAARLRFRFRVLCSRVWGRLLRLHYRIVSRGAALRWRLSRLLFLSLSQIWFHTDYWRSVRAALLAKAPDIVHAHDLNTLYAAWRYSRRTGRPLVYDSHELEMHRNTKWNPVKRVVSRVIESVCIRRAYVITVSEGIADELKRAYQIDRPTVVLNSPRLSDVGTSHEDIRSTMGLTDSASVVVYTGKVAVGRGLEVLCEALQHLPDRFHVAILGPRTAATDTALSDVAAEFGVLDRLHLLAPLAPDEVPTAIRNADVFVNPAQNVCRSYDLALPNKLFDAVFARLPIAVGDLTEMRAFVNEHEVGAVFDETDPRSIAAVLQVLSETKPAGLLDAERVDRLEWLVSWERQEEKLLDLYERIDRRSR